jgi:hypothetical protein
MVEIAMLFINPPHLPSLADLFRNASQPTANLSEDTFEATPVNSESLL